MIDTIEKKANRASMISEIYHAVDGDAAHRAAEGIFNIMEDFEKMAGEGKELKVLRFSMGDFIVTGKHRDWETTT